MLVTLPLVACVSLPGVSMPSGHGDVAAISSGHGGFNEIQAKYWTVMKSSTSGDYCQEAGALEAAHAPPYSCFTSGVCGLYLDALKGSLPPAQLQLARDALVLIRPTDEDKPALYHGKSFAFECGYYSDVIGSAVAELSARELGYNHAPQDAALLVRLVTAGKKITSHQYEAALDGLFDLGDSAALWTATEHLLTAKIQLADLDAVQQLALVRLGALGSPAAVGYCAGAISTAPSTRLKGACLQYLALLGPRPEARQVSTDALVRLLGDTSLGGAAARVLGVLGRREARAEISTMATQHPDRATAFWGALANLGDREAVAHLLLDLDGYPDAAAKQSALEQARRPSESSLEHGVTYFTRPAAMEMAFVSQPAAWRALRGALRQVRPAVAGPDMLRYAYAQLALAQHGEADAAANLAKLLRGPDPAVRAAVLHGLDGTIEHASAWENRTGRGGVANAALLQPLAAFYAAESDPALKRDALAAYARTRTLAAVR